MSWFSFEICRILICEICNDIDLGIEISDSVSILAALAVLDSVTSEIRACSFLGLANLGEPAGDEWRPFKPCSFDVGMLLMFSYVSSSRNWTNSLD